MKLRQISVAVFCVFALGLARTASATSILLVGDDTNTPAAEYTKAGAFIKYIGPSGATGTSFDGLGFAWVGYGSQSLIRKLDSTGAVLATISVTGPEDIEYVNGTLWVSEAFAGSGVHHIDLSGNPLSGGFAAGFASGLTSDGTFLYSSDGFGGSGVITQRDAVTGLPTGVTITTGFGSNLSLAFDPDNGGFWLAGPSSGFVAEYSSSGALMTSETLQTFFHDGFAVGSFSGAAPVPEPTSIVLFGTGVLGLARAWKRRSHGKRAGSTRR